MSKSLSQTTGVAEAPASVPAEVALAAALVSITLGIILAAYHVVKMYAMLKDRYNKKKGRKAP